MLEILLIVVLVLANGFFALSEMSVMTSRKGRLRQLARDSRGARKALELAEHPEGFLSSVQVWITLLGMLTGYFGAETFAERFAPVLSGWGMDAEWASGTAYAVSFTVILYVSVVFGELVPKRIAILYPERLAGAVALPMAVMSALARPFVAVLAASTRVLLRLLRTGEGDADRVTEEEIRQLVADGAEQGVINDDEKAMLNRVLRLGDRSAESLMTPRTRIAWLDAAAPLAENLATLRESPFARYPVCRGGDHEVLGVLEVKRLAGSLGCRDAPALFEQLAPPLFVSASTQAMRLLEILREEQQAMALVVDEYGEVIGIVTTNDLLDAVVGRGQAPGEAAEDEPLLIRREDGSWLVDGRLPVDDTRELLGVSRLPGEDAHDFHTIAGMVVAWFGRLPATGEAFVWEGWRIEVIDRDGARIDKLLLVKIGGDGHETG
ncbi:hemolysin family protein [Silanimonas sp.]|uniref:hemolysin family protein n=1 Tax=Silanimonas sp. TaxID=1929290 RepID=UPI001BC3B6E3|nr:hemolysin family protein [Silanimonas sp.]MBS3895664.1 HlyC/CorC family transporter [Silanimonas sp.]MBS3958079.1 HlyC/CorC family transporter [Xanthomonadaceae bacterium]